jgi:hypothetical protein
MANRRAKKVDELVEGTALGEPSIPKKRKARRANPISSGRVPSQTGESREPNRGAEDGDQYQIARRQVGATEPGYREQQYYKSSRECNDETCLRWQSAEGTWDGFAQLRAKPDNMRSQSGKQP